MPTARCAPVTRPSGADGTTACASDSKHFGWARKPTSLAVDDRTYWISLIAGFLGAGPTGATVGHGLDGGCYRPQPNALAHRALIQPSTRAAWFRIVRTALTTPEYQDWRRSVFSQRSRKPRSSASCAPTQASTRAAQG